MKRTVSRIVIANWKMNPLTETLAMRLASDTVKYLRAEDNVEVVIAPPFIYVPCVREILGSKAILGTQDASSQRLGAHTGEVSVAMQKSMGVKYVIVGHSERRSAGERDEVINQKLLQVVKAGMSAVLCIGEPSRDRAGNYLMDIEKQIRSACEGLPKSKLRQLILAYEPLWAIGSGTSATPRDVQEMKLFIERVLVELYGRNDASCARIIYGGSVTGKNAEVLIREGEVDGFLVGGASLRATEFSDIVTSVSL